MSVDFGVCQPEATWSDKVLKSYGYVPEDVPLMMEGIASVGATRTRFAIRWDEVEVRKGVYTVSYVDRAVAAAYLAGVKPLLCPEHPRPAWGPKPIDYGNLCAFLALRYGVNGFNYNGIDIPGFVDEWEIWNEPNSVAFGLSASINQFVEHLHAASTAIKEVQPDAFIISGGLMGAVDDGTFGVTKNPVNWVKRMYELGDKDDWDAVGNHPYLTGPGFQLIDPTPDANPYVKDAGILAVMDSFGDTTKKIWHTEWGTDSVRFPGELQRDRIAAQWDILTSIYTAHPGRYGPSYPFSYRDWAKPNARNYQYYFGMVDFNYVKKPTWYFWRGLNTNAVVMEGTASGAYTWSHTATGVGDEVILPPTGNVAGTYKFILNQAIGAAPLILGGISMFSHNFALDGSTKPVSVFDEWGTGYKVTGGKAQNNPLSGTNRTDYGGFVHKTSHFSPNHASEVELSNLQLGSAERSIIAMVRSDATGDNCVIATCHWGGSDSAQILVRQAGGVPVVKKTGRGAIGDPGDRLKLEVDGNVYTAMAKKASAGSTWEVMAVWTDLAGYYAGDDNLHTGGGFEHRRSGGVNYDSPGIQNWWYGYDLRYTLLQQGSSSGTFSWATTSVGKGTYRGTVAKAYTWASTIVGKRAPKAVGSGSYTWVAVATSAGASAGIGTGAYTWSSAGVGKKTPKATGTGAYTWSSAGVGKKTPAGTATPAYTWAASAVGVAPPISFSYTFSGSTKPSGIVDVGQNAATATSSSNLVEGNTSGTTTGYYLSVALEGLHPASTVLHEGGMQVGTAQISGINRGEGPAVGFDAAGNNGVMAVVFGAAAGSGNTLGLTRTNIITKVGSTYTRVAGNDTLVSLQGDVFSLKITFSGGVYTYTLYKAGVTTGVSWTDSTGIITPGKFWGASFARRYSAGQFSTHGIRAWSIIDNNF